LAILTLALKWTEDQVRDRKKSNAVLQELLKARQDVGVIMDKIRDLSHTLYPRILDTLGLTAAVKELAHQAARFSSMSVAFALKGKPRPLNKEVEIAIYRCCQEAINNAIRHSEAKRLSIVVRFARSELRITVEDNGRGFNPRKLYDSNSRMMSSGFWTIRQRMADIGAAFRVSTADGHGTVIEMMVPYSSGKLMSEEKISVLLADDHTILRHGLRRILAAEDDIEVVAEAANGLEAVKLAKQLQPNVVIMDISMPDQDGLESLRQIVKSLPSRVLMLTVHLEHQFITEALSAGAAGYLAKDSLDRELISAVRTVMLGGTVLSTIVSKRLAESSQLSANAPNRSIENLTSREREVFILLAEGKSTTEVANSLFVSPKTVHTHRQHIMDKLGLRTTTELIRFALRQGLIKMV
jgi:two-component system response regulator NreC